MLTRFTLPETDAAYAEWSRHTGYDWDSPEWGEMLAALESCGLLLADRLPQQGLFDPPDFALGDAPQVRRLRVAIVTSARLYRRGWGHDPATGALLAAAVMDRFCNDGDTYPVDVLVERLTAELPGRIHAVAASPSEALAGLLAADALAGVVRRYESVSVVLREGEEPPFAVPSLLRVLMSEAEGDDPFAERVFSHLALDPDCGVVLLTLGDGRCALYH